MSTQTDTSGRYQFFALLFLLLFQSSCSDTSPIKIGYIAGLTGRHSELGIGVRNGVMLGIETINSTGGINGRSLELVIRDDKSDPVHGREVVEEFIQMQLPVIIGPLLSKMAGMTLDAIRNQDVLVMSPTISTNEVTDLDDNFFRVIPESNFQAEIIASALSQTDFKKIAIVYDSGNQAYTAPIFQLFKKLMEEDGREVSYVNDLSGRLDNTFSQVAHEIVTAGSEALFLVTSGIDAGELAQQIRKIDSNIQLYGSNWVKSGKIIEVGGRSVEDMIISSNYERDEKTELYKNFSRKFQEKYKAKPNFTSIYGYEAIFVLANGMITSKSTVPEKIKKAILSQGEFQGIEETFRINRFGDVERAKSLVQIQDGQFVRINR